MNKNSFSFILIIITTAFTLEACAPAILVGTATGARVAHDRRSAGTVIDDELIELRGKKRIKQAIAYHKSKAHVNITSYNYIVLLTGEVLTAEMKSTAEATIRKMKKVRRVHNEITIGRPTSKGSRLKDTWITTKAKTSLFNIKRKGFDPTRVKVVTENNVVYLLGLVSPGEAEAAVNKVRTIKGVTKVVKVFEYIRFRRKPAEPGVEADRTEAPKTEAPRIIDSDSTKSETPEIPN
jgi:osmotically-inducible protein OsmY